MSTPPQPPQQQMLPTGASVMEMKCLTCDKPMTVRVPPPRIFNGPDVSVMVFTHEKLDECPSCKQLYLFLLNPFDAEGNLSFKWTKVTARTPPTITPATEADMKKAVQDAKAVNDMKM